MWGGGVGSLEIKEFLPDVAESGMKYRAQKYT